LRVYSKGASSIKTERFGLTTYLRGRKYRSRLEARWSLFFDRLNIRYQHEPKIFEGYLVDFFVPKQPRFVADACFEIKHPDCVESETERLFEFATLELPIYVLTDLRDWRDPSASDNDGYYYFGGGWDNYQNFCQCAQCGIFGIQYQGRSHRLQCSCPKPDDKGWFSDARALADAYQFAAEFRF
jgi:hypothetical protein